MIIIIIINVCLGMLFFAQSERTQGKLKDVVSPCIIEVTFSVDF